MACTAFCPWRLLNVTHGQPSSVSSRDPPLPSADTAELALDERRASGEGGAARRLASAIVQDEYRRRDGRRARVR